MTTFTLDEDQEKRLTKWQNKIKKKYGEYGGFDYIFTPCGMGTAAIVRSHLTKEEINLTDVDKW